MRNGFEMHGIGLGALCFKELKKSASFLHFMDLPSEWNQIKLPNLNAEATLFIIYYKVVVYFTKIKSYVKFLTFSVLIKSY